MEHKIIHREINSLIFAEYNPRQLTKDQYQNLKDSISRFGLVDPIIVNSNKERKNIIVGGHQRVKVAKDMNIEFVPVLEVDLTYEKERELNIRLNKNTGEWDMDNLANFFDMDELIDWGFDEDELILPEEEPIAGLIDDDEVPEVEESICKAGDLWILGEHRLLCGDATKKEDVEVLMDGNKAELLFTSPPYSDMRDYGGNDLSIETLIKFIPTFYPFAEYQVINLGIQRKNHEIVQYWDDYITKAKECGYLFLSWNIWNREYTGSIAQSTAMFGINHEWIFVFGKKYKDLNRTIPNKHNNGGKQLETHVRQKDGSHSKTTSQFYTHKQLNTVINELYETDNKIRSLHPATFPVKIPSEYILAMTNTNDVIADCFLGSGTTLIACEKTGRKCYGMEIDPHYCDVIVKRWEQFTGKVAILDGQTEEV